MLRAIAVMAALYVAHPSALASRGRPAESGFRPEGLAPLAGRATVDTSGAAASNTLAVTADTEVLLDGRSCEYKDIPAGAAVVRMEVAPDRKTILKIEFNAKK